jgi:hypothetical protein
MQVDKSKPRAYTIAILELMDQGVLDAEWLVEALLNNMSERDVKDFSMMHMCIEEELAKVFGEEEEEENEDDL